MLKNPSKIDVVLEELSLQNEYRFNAYQVAYLSEEKDVDDVNEYLLYKSNPHYGVLIPKIEVLCPNNHPDAHFDFGMKLPDSERECRICGSEYIPCNDFSHIVFYFRETYSQEIKKKAKTQDLIVI